MEDWDCGRVPNGEDSSRKTDPWFVLLRFQARDSGGAAHVELDYTGTLISRGYVLAAAEIFDEPTDHDSRDRDPMDENNWKALPGARHIENLDTFKSDEWIDIRRIEIHPLYDGYCIDNNCNQYSTLCKTCANNKYNTHYMLYKITLQFRVLI